MRKKIPLSHLTIGRCFVHDPEGDGGSGLEEGSATTLSSARTVMRPETVWRVLEPAPGASEAEAAEPSPTVLAVSALGEERRLPAGLMVGEVPRGGFDRLVERVADPSDPLGQ